VIKSIFAASTAFVLAATLQAATPAKTKKKHHAVSASSSAKKTGTSARTTSVKTSKTAITRRKGKVLARKPVRSFQQAPTTDRYKEIQQALASKGYYKGEPNGEWGTDSVDALKRFQTDQNLMPDGKINSLSLIALGLGPKRLTAKTEAAPAAAPASPTFEAAPPAIPKPTPAQ